METAGPACLRCVSLDDLACLPAGDALLTRRAKAERADMPSSFASAGRVAVTNDKVCWSGRRRCRKRSEIERRTDGSAWLARFAHRLRSPMPSSVHIQPKL